MGGTWYDAFPNHQTGDIEPTSLLEPGANSYNNPPSHDTPPKFNSSPLKNDAWKTTYFPFGAW